MKPTELQRKIIQFIIEKKVVDMVSFIHFFSNINLERYNGNSFLDLNFTQKWDIAPHQRIYSVMIDESDNIDAINDINILFTEYATLIDFLESEHLIIVFESSTIPFCPILYKDSDHKYLNHFFNIDANYILEKYYQKKIIPTSSMREYVKKNYMTTQELYSQEENKDRKYAQVLTRRIAYISIVGSALIALLSAFFQYLTYTKEREVIIKNQSDTNKVLLINPQTIILDSMKIDSISLNKLK